MIYFTADTHFGHANIIKYCTRPFLDAGEMDRMMVTNWNETVQPSDTVYHLGDFAFASPDRAKHILSNLSGHKVLILGNHDRSEGKMAEWGFEKVYKSLQFELQGNIMVNLSHYPYRGTDDPQHRTKFDHKNLKDDGKHLLCGHVHDDWKTRPGQFKNHMINVGMDQWGFKPVSEPQLLAYLQTLTLDNLK
jgi:calcineurin-like phosphoesterase family protein